VLKRADDLSCDFLCRDPGRPKEPLRIQHKVTTPTRVRFLREGTAVTGLEFGFGEGEAPIQAKKVR
jgi:hypothetical protein